MAINRYEGWMKDEDLRIAARFLRFELPEGADILRLAKVAAFLDGVAQRREDKKAKNREQSLKEGRAEKLRAKRAASKQKFIAERDARKNHEALEKAGLLPAEKEFKVVEGG